MSITATSLVLTSPPALTEHPASVYLSSLAPGSSETMRQSLDFIARLLTDGAADYLTLNWAALRYKHTAAVRASLIKKYSPATVNKMLSALRGVLKEALRLDLIEISDYAKAVDIKSVRLSKKLRGRALSQDEIDALMQACFADPMPAGYRDAALIALLRGAGLRRSEIVNLNLKEFDQNTGKVEILAGKGLVDRVVYVPESAIVTINQWLNLRGDKPGVVICRVHNSGRIERQKLTPQAIPYILKKRGEEAKIAPFSPHDLRRTFVSDLLDADVDLATVQQLAGHASIIQTARYDRRGDERKRRAVQKLHIPVR